MNGQIFVEKVKKVSEDLMAKYVAPEDITPAEAEAVKQKIIAKAKSIVKQEERDAALTKLIALARDVAGDNPDVVEACTLLERKQRTERASAGPRVSAPRTSRFSILDQEFGEVGKVVSEDEMFMKYKMGRKETYWLIADAIKGAKDPEVRKWISFNPETGEYVYESQGANPPEGWTGYVPAALKAPAPKAEAPVVAETEDF